MIRRKQLFSHNPAAGFYGDCHRTAIACLLDMEPQDVPHFAEKGFEAEARGEEYDWRADVERFLNANGLTQIDVNWSDLDAFFSYMDFSNPDVLYLLGGTSPRGTHHTVICRGGGFEWDPHQSNEFVAKPLGHGLYTATFLLPLSMKGEPIHG